MSEHEVPLARDGETLSDEWLALFGKPPEIKKRFAALRAELADARADTERLELIEELIVDAAGRPFDLVNAKSNALVRIETWGSDSFRSVIDAERAARAASGKET